MNILITGIIIFFGMHAFSLLFPAARNTVKARLGEGPYKGIYSLVSLVGLALIIWGFLMSRSGPAAADLLYYPPDWTRHAAMLLVLLGFISLGASHGRGYLKLWLKQPMSLGIALWSGAHLLANGKRADVYMFGAFFALALLDIVLSTARGKTPTHEPKVRSDIVAVVVGVILYLIFLFGFHPYILNLPVTG